MNSLFHFAVCVYVVGFVGALVCGSEVQSSQQPAEEASPLGSEEANEEVNHCGGEDDACSNVVQVVQSFLIGHHIQVPAGYNRHTQRQTYNHIKHTHPHTHTVDACMLTQH